jgi:hypothetical protein
VVNEHTNLNRRKRHRLGFLTILCKSKWLRSNYVQDAKSIDDVLFRPITSCAKHVYSALYRISGQCVGHLLNTLMPAAARSYKSVAQFVQRTDRLNRHASSMQDGQGSLIVTPHYGDLKNFYTNCNTVRSMIVVKEMIATVRGRGYHYYSTIIV